MRIPERLRCLLENWATRKISATPPDFIIRPRGKPQTLRWWVIPRNRWFNIYLHKFVLSDEDRALHDHPWANASILISGDYIEWVRVPEECTAIKEVNESFGRHQGFCYFRRASTAHRVQLIAQLKPTHISLNEDGNFGLGGELIYNPVITLFITGPKVRDWGFWCSKGWRRWQDFCDERDYGAIGRGCE